MLSKNFPSSFSLDNLVYSEKFHGFLYNFFTIEINANIILIGHCPKDYNKKNQKVFKKKILNENNFWNDVELEEANFLFEKKESFRLYDWLLVRVLLKLGLVLYWKKKNIEFNSSFKNITLLNHQRNKPLIKMFSDNQLLIFNVVPFISVSHSKKDIFIALSSNPIGIDTELITKHSEAWEKRIFSDQETTKIFNFLKKWRFLSKEIIYAIMWSIKEATLKMENKIPLGLLPKIIIDINNRDIITKTPLNKKTFKNYISINGSSVLVLTI